MFTLQRKLQGVRNPRTGLRNFKKNDNISLLRQLCNDAYFLPQKHKKLKTCNKQLQKPFKTCNKHLQKPFKTCNIALQKGFKTCNKFYKTLILWNV